MSGEAFIGERHNLTCHASSSFPPPEVTWLVNGVDMTTVAITESTLPTVDGYGEVWSYLTLDLDKSMNGRLAECVLSYRGWDNAVRATFTIQTLYRGGYANSGTVFDNPGAILFPGASSLTSGTESSFSGQGYGANRTATGSRGMFLIRFLKQSATENINWELQQFQP
ncbi:uncharacterized protein LOC128214883 [Mya arenaria]|uniref:uncharacterized protein LOC128214883 n=1 Tax=Mya arenaria TaxID=6604 RepID=UPI0022E6880C|nr:uncharacterized protein LOC128214883 [Mya arenaria]